MGNKNAQKREKKKAPKQKTKQAPVRRDDTNLVPNRISGTPGTS